MCKRFNGMANCSSALKAHRASVKRMDSNKMRKSRMKTLLKKLVGGLVQAEAAKAKQETFDVGALETPFREIQACVMRNVSKNVLHRRTAARIVGRLARRLTAVAPKAS